jgi:hypothetical protein
MKVRNITAEQSCSVEWGRTRKEGEKDKEKEEENV